MKSLLFTGTSGFLGSNILPLLNNEYRVDTLDFFGLSNYAINLSTQIPEFNKSYDIILHAAGKAHSRPKTSADEQEFYIVNCQGTKNLCTGLEKNVLPRSFVFISTVAVYGCDTGELITEDHTLDAETPYGKSKIQAEKYLLEWCERKNIFLTIIRPSLLIGENPPGNLGAMIRGITTGRYVSIADGKARKSMAMANDIGKLIPYCEEKSGIFNLCDDHNPTFKELEKLISGQLNKPLPISIPMWSARCMANVGDLLGLNTINTEKLMKITQSLTFSNEKIKKELGFIPSDVLSNFKI